MRSACIAGFVTGPISARAYTRKWDQIKDLEPLYGWVRVMQPHLALLATNITVFWQILLAELGPYLDPYSH